MQKTLYDLNRAYICTRLNIPELNVKRYENYSYMRNGIARAGVIFRYAKDVTIDKTGYALLLLSDSDDEKLVAKFFDKVVKEFRFNPADLKNLDITPIPLDIHLGD